MCSKFDEPFLVPLFLEQEYPRIVPGGRSRGSGSAVTVFSIDLVGVLGWPRDLKLEGGMRPGRT